MKHAFTGADGLVAFTMLAGQIFFVIYAAKTRGARRVVSNLLATGCFVAILLMLAMSELL